MGRKYSHPLIIYRSTNIILTLKIIRTKEEQVQYLQYLKNYRQKHLEEIKIKQKIWRIENREKLLISKKNYYKNNKELDLNHKRETYQLKREEIKKRTNAFYHKNKTKFRLEVLNHYSGGVIKCRCCGYSGFPFMTIDHINGWRHLHKRRIGGISLIWWLRKHNYPQGFQVLCYNCNCSKGFFGQCGHKFEWKPDEKRRRYKLEFLKVYSNNSPKCSCCGETNVAFLTIDHINGGGHKDVDSNGRQITGNRLYHKLKRLGFPQGYQVLCYNCNCAKHYNKECPHKTMPNLN